MMSVEDLFIQAVKIHDGQIGVADVRAYLDYSDEKARRVIAKWSRLGVIQRDGGAWTVLPILRLPVTFIDLVRALFTICFSASAKMNA